MGTREGRHVGRADRDGNDRGAVRISAVRLIEEGCTVAATHVNRAEIVSILRSRGKHARADWFERELPEIVDIAKNRSLLATLEIDPAELGSVDRALQHA